MFTSLVQSQETGFQLRGGIPLVDISLTYYGFLVYEGH